MDQTGQKNLVTEIIRMALEYEMGYPIIDGQILTPADRTLRSFIHFLLFYFVLLDVGRREKRGGMWTLGRR